MFSFNVRTLIPLAKEKIRDEWVKRCNYHKGKVWACPLQPASPGEILVQLFHKGPKGHTGSLVSGEDPVCIYRVQAHQKGLGLGRARWAGLLRSLPLGGHQAGCTGPACPLQPSTSNPSLGSAWASEQREVSPHSSWLATTKTHRFSLRPISQS